MAVTVRVGVAVTVAVSVGVGVGVRVAVVVGVGVRVGVRVTVGVGVRVAVCVGVGITTVTLKGVAGLPRSPKVLESPSAASPAARIENVPVAGEVQTKVQLRAPQALVCVTSLGFSPMARLPLRSGQADVTGSGHRLTALRNRY